MQIFYTDKIEGSSAVLDERETRHCLKVLRKRIGDEIMVTDGLGNCFKARIESFSKKSTSLNVLKLEKSEEVPSRLVFLVFSPTKSAARFEWMIEKCVEIGISGFIPILCQNSERKKMNMERTSDIILSAMKQSGRLFLPELHPMTSLDGAISLLKTKSVERLYTAGQKARSSLIQEDDPSKNSAVFIGPEGDFSEEELKLMHQNGMIYVNLNNYRLRTETAGVVAISFLNSARVY
ncbi:MAG: 16S rRNA (uracil(1498)-N(3))-methyltransferase [Saprospirales bacterium]|nr:MAG: 16S rRNA (uracil(1498)-N(3))-methyltransferase [Saprospirales bacterium]